MRINLWRSVALTLGICTCGVAQAQYGGQAPATAYGRPGWNAPGQNNPALNGPAQYGQAQYGQAQYGQAQYGQSYGQSQYGQAYGQAPAVGGSTPAHPPAGHAAAAAPPGARPSGAGYGSAFDGHAAAYAPPASSPAYRGYPASPYRTVSSDSAPLGAPAPVGAPAPIGSGASGALPVPAPTLEGLPYHGGGKAPSAYPPPPSVVEGGSCGQVYTEAAAAPWIGSAPMAAYGHGAMLDAALPVRNWFAGSSLLFFDFEDECNRRLVFDDGMPSDTILSTGDVSPGSDVGFESFLGRYIACGKYAITASYMYFNPGEESVTRVAPMVGDYRMAIRNWDRMYIDLDGDGMADDWGVGGDATDDHLYQLFDDTAAYRVRRDVEFQGLEFNFVSFGIGGATRGGVADCGSCAPNACGGACGLLVPPCNSRMQFQISHGLRWFQFRDEFELGTTTIANGYGSGNDDFYYNIDTENNLFGYQFGGRAHYCVTRRVNLYAGGKFGIYGNHIDYYSRIGTRGTVAQVGAYYPSMQGDSVEVSRDDTVLASLGELDLGLGVRLTDCWTLTGGYRLLGVTGVATSVGSISDDPANLSEGHLTCVNDSILLHGGYIGVHYNW